MVINPNRSTISDDNASLCISVTMLHRKKIKPKASHNGGSVCCLFLLTFVAYGVCGFSPQVHSPAAVRSSLSNSVAAKSKFAISTGTLRYKSISEANEENLDDTSQTFSHDGRTNLPYVGNLLEFSDPPVNPLDQSQDPLVNALGRVRRTLSSCPELWGKLAELCPDTRAVLDVHLCDEVVDLDYSQMEQEVRKSAAAFASLGVEKGDNVAIFGENSAHWLLVDQGIQMAGGVSVVRGADAPMEELCYIFENSDSVPCAVLQGPSLLAKLAKHAKEQGTGGLGLSNDLRGPVGTVVLMHREGYSDEEISDLASSSGVTVHLFADLIKAMKPLSTQALFDRKKGREDLCTIVYTSGTTGRPKGVMLTHGNLLHQINLRFAPTKPYDETEPLPGDVSLALLPIWHITERSAELCTFSRGVTLVYSTVRTLKNDLATYKPNWMVLVPRVLEKIAQGVQDKAATKSIVVRGLVKLFRCTGRVKANHSKIARGLVVGSTKPTRFQKIKSRAVVAMVSPLNFLGQKLVWRKVQSVFGGKQKIIVSGGSALAGYLESFYEVCGIPVVVGYGLTETSPIIAHRRSDSNLATAGCVGKPMVDTEVRVVDPDSGGCDEERKPLPDGEIGVVLVRGPQVMRGYYKNEEKTNEEIDRFGWFDTGDLGMINPATGDLIMIGRCKDTIVLSNGENIEPTPIEDAIVGHCRMIEQVMLTGQDGKHLKAITVLNLHELTASGFLDEATGEKLQLARDKVNDPKCTAEDCEENCMKLEKAAEGLRNNKRLTAVLKSDMKKACDGFRSWEQVSDVLVTLEPFAMANGMLTQSYKVKRDKVLKRYEKEL